MADIQVDHISSGHVTTSLGGICLMKSVFYVCILPSYVTHLFMTVINMCVA